MFIGHLARVGAVIQHAEAGDGQDFALYQGSLGQRVVRSAPFNVSGPERGTQKNLLACASTPPSFAGAAPAQHPFHLHTHTHTLSKKQLFSLQGYPLPDQVMDGHVRQWLDQGALK